MFGVGELGRAAVPRDKLGDRLAAAERLGIGPAFAARNAM